MNPADISTQATTKPTPVKGQLGMVWKIANSVAATAKETPAIRRSGVRRIRRRRITAAAAQPQSAAKNPVTAKNPENGSSGTPGITKRAATITAGTRAPIPMRAMSTIGMPNARLQPRRPHDSAGRRRLQADVRPCPTPGSPCRAKYPRSSVDWTHRDAPRTQPTARATKPQNPPQNRASGESWS